MLFFLPKSNSDRTVMNAPIVKLLFKRQIMQALDDPAFDGRDLETFLSLLQTLRRRRQEDSARPSHSPAIRLTRSE